MIGRPFYPPVVNVGVTKKFNVFGKSFFRINGLFLSGNDVFGRNTFFNPFSASTKLSAHYPGFYAIQLSATDYIYDNNSKLTFTMPSALSAGYVDLILMNDAGWGSLTQFVIKDFENPFLSGSDLFDSYEPYERPWKRGIIVTPTLTFFETDIFVSFIPHPDTDSDFDGYTDEIELMEGTSPNDPNDFPISIFSVYNNV